MEVLITTQTVELNGITIEAGTQFLNQKDNYFLQHFGKMTNDLASTLIARTSFTDLLNVSDVDPEIIKFVESKQREIRKGKDLTQHQQALDQTKKEKAEFRDKVALIYLENALITLDNQTQVTEIAEKISIDAYILADAMLKARG